MYAWGLWGLFLLLPLSLWGQEDSDGKSFDFKGFVDTYCALRSASPLDFMSARTRARGEIERTFGNSKVAISLNATYNALLPEETGIRLREAYFDHQEQHWGLRVGRQLVIWGAADGVRITDLLSPMDMSEFLTQDYDDIRMPINAFRFSLFNETMRLEAIVVPTFEGFRLPVSTKNPWSLFPSNGSDFIWKDEGKPAFKAANIEYGGRWSVTLPGIDFSLAALHTWNKMPILELHPISAKEVHVLPHYHRMGVLGGDCSIPLGQLVLRGEAAFNIDKYFAYREGTSQHGFNTLHWLVGADWYAPNEWMLSGQFSMENIFKYEEILAQKNHSALLTLNISKKLFGSTLQLSDFTYIDLTGKGWLSRFTIDYALSDQVHLLAGYDWLGSKGESTFTLYKNNSEAWLKARYNF